MSVRAVTFPRSDAVFARFVADVLQATPGASIGDVEARVRTLYSHALIRRMEPMAGFGGDPVWYFYRDGRLPTGTPSEWWSLPGVAEATFGSGGVYVHANDEFCVLHGLPPGGVVGRRWEEFATPEALAEADALWQHLVEAGSLEAGQPIQSTFTLLTADGRLQPVEYRTVAEGGGSFRTWMRPLGEAEDVPPEEMELPPTAVSRTRGALRVQRTISTVSVSRRTCSRPTR